MIFDVGGVLVRTENRRPRTMLADAFGLTYPQMDEMVFNSKSGQEAQVGARSAETHWAWVAGKLNLRPDEIGSVRGTFFSGDVLDIGLLDFLRNLPDRYQLAILSNAPDDAREWLTGKFRLGEVFDPIVISAEEKVMKPDPEIYRITLNKCAAQPEEAVFIDDFPQNVSAAREMGMQAIWFRSREQVIVEIRELLGLS